MKIFHDPDKSNNLLTDNINTDDDVMNTSNIDTRKFVSRLRLQFLTPIIVTLSFAVIVIITTVYFHEHKTIDSDIIQLQSSANNLYINSIQKNAKALQTIMDVVKTDQQLVAALAKRDRHKLLQHTATIYEDISRHYGISHFYFTAPDRVNILRVHKPEKYGDTINRKTTLIAKQSGADAYGIELGPLGTLTLRYVQPWYEKQTHKLIGFVELGMEVDQTLDSIRKLFGIDLFVLIKKQYINQKDWEEGMRTFGRTPDWQHFPQMVISLHGMEFLPEALSKVITETDFSKHTSTLKVALGQGNKHVIFQPLQDIDGRTIGTMVMLLDTSNLASQIQESVIIGSVAVIFSAIILILFFYWFVGRIGVRMAHDEQKLEQLATHDELTGLFNRRKFNLMLEEALEIHRRYSQPVSLLMIDIDHFKKVNDSYGHPAGDTILIELAHKLTRQARTIDRVCRYGGEEFILLLPETNSANASAFAKRLCNLMASKQWTLDTGKQITVTISIGVASCLDQTCSAQELIKAADKALYIAKETGRNRVFHYDDINKEQQTK